MATRHACLLCRYSGGSNSDINEVAKYIHDNIAKLSVEEIAHTVHEELGQYLAPGEACSHADIVEHILQHSQEHNIVICTLLRDVRALSQDLLRATRVQREDDSREIDLRTAAVFFKSVELAAMLSARMHEK